MGYEVERRTKGTSSYFDNKNNMEEGYMHVVKMLKVPEMLEHALVCPECGSAKVYHEGRDMYCLNCSLVIIEGGD